MLVIDKDRRKSMAELFDSVDKMHQRAVQNIDYIRESEPREVILEARYMTGVHLNNKIENILENREEKRKQVKETLH
jgi:hypothetical protein